MQREKKDTLRTNESERLTMNIHLVGIRFANAHYPDIFVVKSMIPKKLE